MCALVIALWVFFLIDNYRGAQQGFAIVTLAAVGGFFAGGGFVSAAAEIVLGLSKWARLGFSLLAVVAVSGGTFRQSSRLAEEVFGFSMIAIALLGLIAFGGRLIRRREAKKSLRRIDGSLRSGSVVRFEGAVHFFEEPDEKDQADLPELRMHTERHEVEVLVPAGILLRADGEARSDLEVVETHLLAAPDSDAPTAPLQRFDLVEPVEGFEMRQRHLTDAETREIRLSARRTLLLGLVTSLCTLGAIAAFTRVIESLVRGIRDVGLRLDTLAISAVIPAVMLMWFTYQWWLLRRDSDEHMVVVGVRKAAAGEDLTEEQLPWSRRTWTLNGVPAEWRSAIKGRR
jgi:hypothetical protein